MSDPPTAGGTHANVPGGTGGTRAGTTEHGTAPLRYSVPAVARLFGISERAIRKRIETNQLFAVKEDRAWVVLLDPDAIPRAVPVPPVPQPTDAGTATSIGRRTHEGEPIDVGPADVWLSTTVADPTTRETAEPAVPDAVPDHDPAVPGTPDAVLGAVPTTGDAVPGPQVDLTPLVNLVADLTRRNAELTEAATLWQIRAHDLEQRLKQLGAGFDGPAEPIDDQHDDAPTAAPEPPEATEGTTEGGPASWWSRAFRKVAGG